MLGIVAIVLVALGVGAHTVGLSVVYWIVSYPFRTGYGVGLWQTCSIIGCHTHPYTPDYWKATQAFVVIGFVVGVLALLLTILGTIKSNKTFRILAAVSCFVAAGCIIAAVIIFASETRLQRSTQWGWGFILCIVSTFLLVPAGILNILQFRKAS